MQAGSPPRGDRGIALVLVAIVLAALSLIIAAVAESARQYTRETISRIEAAQLRAALDAGTATAAYDLSTSSSAMDSLLGHSQMLRIGDAAVSMSVRPESSKVDLNYADPVMIGALLQVRGVASADAVRFADEIVDWRDPDDEPRPHGAEAADYIAAGKHYVPPNRAFADVSEVSLVLHGTSDLAACLAPDVTVFAASSAVDVRYASDAVRRAATMAAALTHASVVSAGWGSVVGGSAVRAGAVFEIDATAVDNASGQRLTRTTVVRVTNNPRDPIWFVSRQSPSPSEAESHAACDRLKLPKSS